MSLTSQLADLGRGAALRGLALLPPETAHRLAIRALASGLAGSRPLPARPRLEASLCGLDLPHPLGLAAGFDKNAEAVGGLLAQGFAFVEIGTVTPRPQAGNPRPRLFRLRRQQALINRMGFNNDGLEAVRRRLAAQGAGPGVLGANLGANKDSAHPIADYLTGLQALYPLVDYVTVNVSSPNTPGLRDLQRRERLQPLLAALLEARAGLAAGRPLKPLLLKIAPDLEPAEEADIAEVALAQQIDGLIISNTTLARPEIVTGPLREQAGGLSGVPLFLRSTEQLARFFRLTSGRLPLIGVGGIASGADAYAKIRAGASALQLYTSFVYKGPAVIERVLRELDQRLAADGFARLADAVGADHAARARLSPGNVR
jgi:dihydroorotate dehydrogenase